MTAVCELLTDFGFLSQVCKKRPFSRLERVKTGIKSIFPYQAYRPNAWRIAAIASFRPWGLRPPA